MIQVKEFLNYQTEQESEINKWLKEQGVNIDIIDIKYSVNTFQQSDSYEAQEYSGALVIYKILQWNVIFIQTLGGKKWATC